MANRSVKALDDLFSEFIRRRAIKRCGGCERCLTLKYDTTREDGSTRPAYMQLQAAHFIGRSAKSIKWDEDNAAGLCGGCHTHVHGRSEEWAEWYKSQLGEMVHNALLGRWRQMVKPDIALLVLYYRHKIKELECES